MKIKIPSIKENVGVVESFIDNVRDKLNSKLAPARKGRDKLKINDNVYGNVLIAVTEAVNNAIVHGNKEKKRKKVEISLKHSKNKLSFIVSDEGVGFDEKKIPDPTNPKNVTNIKGRGVFLMKALSDEIFFKNKGSLVRLVFHLT